MTTAIDGAAEAFRSALSERGALVGVPDEEARDLGRRAALLVGGATLWREHLGDLLDVRAVMSMLKVTTRQAVYDLVTRRRLLALPRRGGSMLFPAFQFDSATGRPHPVVADVVNAFAAAQVDPYTVATWLATPQDELDGRSPVALLADSSSTPLIVAAAERAAARLSH